MLLMLRMLFMQSDRRGNECARNDELDSRVHRFVSDFTLVSGSPRPMHRSGRRPLASYVVNVWNLARPRSIRNIFEFCRIHPAEARSGSVGDIRSDICNTLGDPAQQSVERSTQTFSWHS